MYIYMSRHGESVNNVLNIIGGDCHLSEHGKQYNKFLCDFFKDDELYVWTSGLKRTKETSSGISSNTFEWSNLNEINAGDFDGLTLDTIRDNYPVQYKIRNNNKLTNSYPNGESYLDLHKRVIKVLKYIDVTEDNTLLIIAHQAVCRVIYSYFTKTPLEQCTNIEIKLHTLYNLVDKEFIPISSNI